MTIVSYNIMNAVSIESLQKRFTTKDNYVLAVDSLSLTIPKGKIVGLLGPNGAGKTTTIRIIASIYSPTKGKIIVNGLDTEKDSIAIRKIIGIAHENPSFYKRLSGRRNLRFYAELYDVPKDEIDPKINQLAEEFELIDAIDQPVGGYSKGMKQKLSVAKALIHDPQILIMDEPWSGLSPGATRDLRRKIQELGNSGKTLLISTHNLAQAEMVVDKLVIISKGRLVATGSPDDLRQKYHLNPQVELLIEKQEKDIEISQIINLDFVSDVSHTPVKDNIRVIISLNSFNYTPDLVKKAVSLNWRIKEIREKIPSLEEIYLELVEEEN